MPITLDKAIRIHLNNERMYLSPLNSTALRHSTELHISIFETTPRDIEIIKARIVQKGKGKRWD
ncbi:MAG TPA: hypothetical protein VF172_05645 [Nitrososphaera sp.]